MGDWVLAAAIGFVSGVLSGAFGIGGGIITTPAIRLLLGAPALIAVGTPLPVIMPGAITGALQYRRSGLLDVRSGLTLAFAGTFTAIGGAVLATMFGGAIVLLGTALLVFFAAADTLVQVFRPSRAIAPDDPAYVVPSTVPLVCIGALTGLYSGFFGLGGGFVLVPLLTRWIRMPVKRAIGTSLMTVALLAIPGTISHAFLGNIDWGYALALAVGVVPGAMIGARVSMESHDRSIRIGFALLLIVAGAVLALNELGAL